MLLPLWRVDIWSLACRTRAAVVGHLADTIAVGLPPSGRPFATWLGRSLWTMDPAQRGADRAALQAIALFHLASRPPCGWPETTCECSGSPDIYVIERGEPADALYLILNGTADALR